MKKIKKHGFNIANLSIILLALSFYVSTVFDAGASQKKHEGAVPVRGTAETREDDVNAEETARICSDAFINCLGEYQSGQTGRTVNALSLGFVGSNPTSPIMATISWYSAIDSCHTGASCLMANGKKAEVGYVACPRRIKLGTRVLIDGVKYTCGDRTAKFVDGRFDIFVGYGIKAYRLALKNGLQTKIVEIL